MKDPLSSINEKLAEISSRLPQSPKGASEWLDIGEAAEYLKLSKSAIYKRTMNSTISFYRTGRKLMFKRSELDKFILSSRSSGPSIQGIKIER